MNIYFKLILQELEKHYNAEKAKWLINYVKHDIKSIGVGIPEIRSIVQNVCKQNKLNELTPYYQKEILDELVKHDYTEAKLSAIIYIQLFQKEADAEFQLSMFSNWFDKKWIYDWNVCDWLCVRLLSPLIDNHPEPTISELKKWNRDNYLWKARASLVPFAQCISLSEHLGIVDEFNKSLIKRNERFCKTAVGWSLRELSRLDERYVKGFLEAHHAFVTSEVKKNATKYFTE